jgi:hypothetical protein
VVEVEWEALIAEREAVKGHPIARESSSVPAAPVESLTGPLRDARRFPSTRWYPVPEAMRTTLGFGICPSFKGHFLSRRAKP